MHNTVLIDLFYNFRAVLIKAYFYALAMIMSEGHVMSPLLLCVWMFETWHSSVNWDFIIIWYTYSPEVENVLHVSQRSIVKVTAGHSRSQQVNVLSYFLSMVITRLPVLSLKRTYRILIILSKFYSTVACKIILCNVKYSLKQHSQ